VTRHFLSIQETPRDDLATIYALATAKVVTKSYEGEPVALLFERPSLRTRASSSVAVYELGGLPTVFNGDEFGMDTRESAEDIARVLTQMYAVAALRLKSHDAFVRMRAVVGESLSLINLLSDQAHPAQAVADVLTIAEYLAQGDTAQLSGLEVAYVGDATNVTRSLAVALLRLGVNVRVGAPRGYQIGETSVENPLVEGGDGVGQLTLVDNAVDAVRGADVVYTDAWVSMGAEAETEQRRKDLSSFRVDQQLLSLAKPTAIFLHCLPAHRGDEVTNEVLDGAASAVWRQAYHRRTAMLGILRWLKGETP